MVGDDVVEAFDRVEQNENRRGEDTALWGMLWVGVYCNSGTNRADVGNTTETLKMVFYKQEYSTEQKL